VRFSDFCSVAIRNQIAKAFLVCSICKYKALFMSSEQILKLFIYCLIFTFTLVLFYELAINHDNLFADLYWHIKSAHSARIDNLFSREHGLSYPLFHIIVYYLTKFLLPSYNTWAAFVLAISVVSSIAILDYYMRRELREFNFNEKFIFVLSIGLTIFMPLYIPSFNGMYLGQFSGQPWHNPTYIIMKPFSILCFFWFYDFFRADQKDKIIIYKYHVSKQNINVLIFSILLFVSLLAKPSFLFAFMPTVAVFTIIELVRFKFKNLLLSCKLAVSMIPSIVLLLVQRSVTLTLQGSEIVFSPFEVWKIYSTSIPLSFALAWAFPIFVCCLVFRSIFQNRLLLLSLIAWLIGLCEFSLLAEKGPRLEHANIGWSLLITSFLLFIVCTIVFLQYTRTSKNVNSRSISCGFILLFLHISNGIYYFLRQFNGGPS